MRMLTYADAQVRTAYVEHDIQGEDTDLQVLLLVP